MRNPLLVINLDRSVERWAVFSAMAREQGLDVTRLPAIDGAALRDADFERLRDHNVIYPLSRPEVGCYLSHLAAWRTIRDSGAEWGVVFEDDAVFAPGIRTILEHGDALAPRGLVRLEASTRPVALARGGIRFMDRELRALSGRALGACAYLVSRRACETLISVGARPSLPVDLFLFDVVSPLYPELAPLLMLPAPVVQRATLTSEISRAEIATTIPERGKQGGVRLPVGRRLRKKMEQGRRIIHGLGATRTSISWH